MDIGKALASQGKVRRYFDTDYRPAWDWLNEHYAEVLPQDYVIWEIPHEDLAAAGAEGARVIGTTIIVDPYWDEQKAAEEAQDRDDLAVSPHDVHPEPPSEYAMYDATHEIMHLVSERLGDHPFLPHREYWVAVRMIGYSLEVEGCTEEEILDLDDVVTYRRIASDALGLPIHNNQWTIADFYGPDATSEQRQACDELATKWAKRILAEHARLMTLEKPYRVPPEWVEGWTLE